MALLKKKNTSEKKNIPQSESRIASGTGRKRKSSRKTGKKEHIIREITWPSFPSAVMQAFACAVAVAGLGAIIYFYEYGIHQLIALLR